MKTVLFATAAAALAFSAPAFAQSTVGEGVVVMSGPNAVSTPTQLNMSNGTNGLDAVTLIRLEAAASDDDSMAIYSLRSAPETVSTQSASGAVSGQFVTTLGHDASSMTLSDAVSAYFDEVAD